MPACNLIKNQVRWNIYNNITPCCSFDPKFNKLSKTINDYHNSQLYKKLLDSDKND